MPEPRFQPGVMIGGKYTLVEEVGSGGFGSVWRAVARDGASAALKFLKPNLGGAVARRFLREAAILERLRHPHIVAFHGFEPGDADALSWLATDFVEGPTLSEWIGPHRSIEDGLRVSTQIAQALVAAHRAGVVHRDLKPANIIVGERDGAPHVTVLDFGLARLLDDRCTAVTVTGEMMGTPGYMSPEQLRGQRDIGPATDLYCLGAVVFAIFEHRPVFTGDTALEISMKHLTDPPPPMRAPVPAAVKGMVAHLLAKDAAGRPASADAVLNALAPQNAGPVLERQRPRNVALTAAILVAAIVVAAVAFWAGSRAHEPAAPPVPPLSVPTTPRERVADADVGTPTVSPAPRASSSAGCAFRLDPPAPDGVVHRPPGDRNTPLPLLVVLHENGQTPAGVIEETDLVPLANRERFIVAAPPVVEHRAFEIVDFVDDVKEAYCVDEDRVYVLGHGRGADMMDRLTTLPIFAAAVATAHRPSHSDLALRGRSRRPVVPYLLLTAVDDRVEPIEGRGHQVSLAQQEDQLRLEHGCEGEAVVVEDIVGGECRTWSCEVELRSCVIEGNRHWPGDAAETKNEVGAPSAFEHQARVWEFLSRHRRSHAQPKPCTTPWGPGRYSFADDVAYVPKGRPSRALPLIIGLHESDHTPADLLDELDLFDLADEDGVILYSARAPLESSKPTLVHGASADGPSWKPRDILVGTATELAWFDRAFQTATSTFCVDLNAVYVVGHAASGRFAESLRADDRIAAVATFSHRSDWREVKTQNYEVTAPYLFIAPLNDDDHPPGRGGIRTSIDQHTAHLVEQHECVGKEPSLQRKHSTCWTWKRCRVPLMACHIQGTRHWPTHYSKPPPTDFDHQRVLWDFLMAHRREAE